MGFTGIGIKQRDLTNEFMDLGLFENKGYSQNGNIGVEINHHILGYLSSGQTLLSSSAALVISDAHEPWAM